jgi:hypothetical protein
MKKTKTIGFQEDILIKQRVDLDKARSAGYSTSKTSGDDQMTKQQTT